MMVEEIKVNRYWFDDYFVETYKEGTFTEFWLGKKDHCYKQFCVGFEIKSPESETDYVESIFDDYVLDFEEEGVDE